MNAGNPISAMTLANTYATYFARDFALDIMRHLGGSHPISQEQLVPYVEGLVAANPITIGSTNAINRFLFECAEYALEQRLDNPASGETWKAVSNLPSAHHGEIQSLIFSSACMYRDTVDRTIVGVIARDAHIATESIAMAAQERTTQAETGGELVVFNWGILNDGLFLNSALLKAYEMASIFRPGDRVNQSYTQTAFGFARQHANLAMLDADLRTTCYAELDSLIANSQQAEMTELLGTISQDSLSALLFDAGHLTHHVSTWEQSLTNPAQLVQSVVNLSALAQVLMALTATARQDGMVELVSETTLQRLDKAYDVAVLALAGFEAQRETRFAETLIMNVEGMGADPKVKVIVNDDTMHSYTARGGEEMDLIRYGLHLDPRRGTPLSSTGWSMSYVEGGRDNVIPRIMAEESDRLERMRSNDASVIQSETTRIVSNLTKSYLEARSIDTMSPALHQSIGRLARNVTNSESDIQLDNEIIKILTATLDDPFVTSMTDRLVNNLATTDMKMAQTYAIAETAVADAIAHITDAGSL